jgi:heme/copper-type cytochrome/quinol oxidase subunit 1
MFSSNLLLFCVCLFGLFCFFHLAYVLGFYGRNNRLEKIRRQSRLEQILHIAVPSKEQTSLKVQKNLMPNVDIGLGVG